MNEHFLDHVTVCHRSGILEWSYVAILYQEYTDHVFQIWKLISVIVFVDPSNMGGLSLLFMAGQQNASKAAATSQTLDLSREKVGINY